MTTYLNTYANVFSPNITSSITSTDWLNLIRGSSIHLDTITEARKYKLLYKDTGNEFIKTEYDKIKETLPAITWNGLFSEKKCNQNFISGTGLMYIDIDSTDFKIESLDLNKIYSYYQSIGGLGYSLLVRVDGITLDNFKSTYNYITNDLGLECDDTNAVKPTQYSILSYDPNLYINEDSFIYSTIEPEINTNNSFCTKGHIISQKKEEHNVTVGTKSEIRFNNVNDFDFEGKEYIENWNEGLSYVECNQPFKPLGDGRKRYMLNYIRNYVWLNPNAQLYQIINSALAVNISLSIDPLPRIIIEQQVTSILKQKNVGKLVPKIKKRRIIFNPKSLLSSDEKQKLRAKSQSQYYTNAATTKIYEVIEDWNFEFNGKITIRSVAQATGLAPNTVSKYWAQVKEYARGLNEDNTTDIKAFKQHKAIINKDIKEENLIQLMEDMDVLTIREQALIINPNCEFIDENINNDSDLIFLDADIF
ncbi:BT4734/BF3469 family protein [Pedobacter immunditicola]|uniref:BT4734/BF3469 family protein n=1 Tax=Pedobacter immunditicola TaxID=3133440 RepID=UPI0030B713E0